MLITVSCSGQITVTELYFVTYSNSYAAPSYDWPTHEKHETQENPVYRFSAGQVRGDIQPITIRNNTDASIIITTTWPV